MKLSLEKLWSLNMNEENKIGLREETMRRLLIDWLSKTKRSDYIRLSYAFANVFRERDESCLNEE